MLLVYFIPRTPDIAPHAHAPTTTQTSNDVTNFDVAVVMLESVVFFLFYSYYFYQIMTNGSVQMKII